MLHCTVYNQDHQELDRVTAIRAVTLVYFKECAITMEEHSDKSFQAGAWSFPAPSKIVLKRYVDVSKRYLTPAHMNRHNIKVRDNFTCQYCGRHRSKFGRKERLTMDHIIPRSRGGLHKWDNVVSACSTCNNSKDNRTPSEANMHLRCKPYTPTIHEIRRKREEHKERRKVIKVVA